MNIINMYQAVIARKRVAGGSAVLNESFETGEGSFDLAAWSENDTDGVISTYDTNFANTGTHSLSVIYDADSTTAHNRVIYDLGSNYTGLYARFYIETPTLTTNGTTLTIMTFGESDNVTNNGPVYIQYSLSSGTFRLRMRTAVTNPPDYFALTGATKYRIEIHVATADTCTLKVFDAAGDPVEINTGGGVFEQTITGWSPDTRYIIINDDTTEAAATTAYFDDVAIDPNATGFIGPQ